MFQTIRARLITIAVLAGVSVYSLFPRNQTVRTYDQATGRMKDTVVRVVPISLGLDLRGGIHLGLEIDQSQQSVPNPEDALERALTVIRQRINEFGTREPVVQKVGNERIIVELPGEEDPDRAKQIVQRSAFLEFKITDMQGLFRDAIPEIDAALREAGIRAPTGERTGVSAVERLLGGDTAADTTQADTLPELDPAGGPLSTHLLVGQLPGEYLVPDEKFELVDSIMRHPAIERLMPRGYEWRWGAEVQARAALSYRPLYVVERQAVLTGDALTDAQAQFDELNQPIVIFELTRSAGRRFARATAENIGNHMAIILDGRVVSQPPVIQSQIRNRGQIDLGRATLQEAQDLALVLRAGALPAPLTIVEERTVGPTLGRDSIKKAEIAGLVGLGLLVLFMLAYYRLAGALAICALALYALFTMGGLALFGLDLTLPGMAGLILSLGMALDANVLIFERIREELGFGKSVRTAVDEGFAHAMSAIVDSNVTTVITALFLFNFGTGPVRGFAVALVTGIIASFITAVFVTRTFFLVWLQRRPGLATLSI